MKVVIAHPYLILKGGAERVMLKIAQHYDAKLYVLEYNREKTFEELRDTNIEIIGQRIPFSSMLPYRASQGLRAGYTFYNFKMKDDYDLVTASTSPSEWARNKNAPMLWYCHTPVREVYDLYAFRMKNRSRREKLLYVAFTNAYKLIAKNVIKKIENIATNSTNTNSRIQTYFKRSAQVINPGIDYEEFTNKGDDKYFLYPSRFYLNKRQDYVIDAFSKFLRKTNLTNYKLILAGSISDDKEHLEYFEKLKKKNVRNVSFKLNLSDAEIRRLYSRATAVLFAAVNEDFGIVPLEAMASQKPIISVNEGGPMETILNNKTGFLVDSPEQMADKMKFVAEHADISERMGREGRKRVKGHYSWESFFKKFDALARKTAKGP